MSILHKSQDRKSKRGQTMVEFALAFPIFLLIVLGIFEFGRLFVIYTSVYAAAREGARYGAAVDNLCNSQIESQAERAGFLAGDLTINTTYNVFDKNLQIISNDCADAKAGDMVVVEASVPFEFITGFIPVPGGGPIDLRSTARRTIIKKVYVDWTLAPVPVSTSVSGLPPTATNTPGGSTPSATSTPDPNATATPSLPTCEGSITVTTSGSSPYLVTIVNNGVEYYLDSLTVYWKKNNSDFVKVTMGSNYVWEGNLPDSPATLTESDLGWLVGSGTTPMNIYFSGSGSAQFEKVEMTLSTRDASGNVISQCSLP